MRLPAAMSWLATTTGVEPAETSPPPLSPPALLR